MIRGIYTAAAGMVAESIRNDTVANNLANATTTGYKKDIAVTKDFRTVLLQRINDGEQKPVIGSMGSGAEVDEIATIHTAGALRPTGNTLDVALEGKGFFVVETPNGMRYTRCGAFTLNAQGELTTAEGYRVQGENGTISLAGARKISVSEDGRISITQDDAAIDETEVGRLKIVAYADEKQLVKEGANLFRAEPGAREEQAAASVHSGMLEQSNVNAVAEMINMIACYRAYEVNAKAVQSHDEMLDKAVNSVGSVS